MKIYHGTSYDNYVDYMKNNIIPPHKNWNQSDDNHMYFYGDRDEYFLEDAYNSAITCAAIHASQYNKVVVLVGEIDDNLLTPDNSDGLLEYEDNRFYIDKGCFNLKHFKPIFFRYRPDIRAKYLYHHYHNTRAIRWGDIKDHVFNPSYIEFICDIIYNEIGEYEYDFPEIRYENNILGELK